MDLVKEIKLTNKVVLIWAFSYDNELHLNQF